MSIALEPAVFRALGTTAVVLATEPGAVEAARAAVEDEVAAVDGACSRFRDDSDLARLNAGGGRPVPVSPVLLDAIEVALRAARLTAGRVDPTVGSAMKVIGYDRTFGLVERAGPPLRVTLAPVPGWQQIRVDRRAGTATVPAGVEVDLGATAKAWCADRAARAAAAASGAGVLVSLGGDIAVAGPAPDGGWPIKVGDDHAAPLEGPGQTVAISEGGLATSGTAVRRWVRGGRTLHHLIDPSTGLPADTIWRTVSVAAASCADANTASTAGVILGPAAVDWLIERRLPARLVDVDGAVTVLNGWPAEDV